VKTIHIVAVVCVVFAGHTKQFRTNVLVVEYERAMIARQRHGGGPRGALLLFPLSFFPQHHIRIQELALLVRYFLNVARRVGKRL